MLTLPKSGNGFCFDQYGSRRLVKVVVRAKRGEIEAFQELYGFYVGRILGYAYRMTRSREEAEDLTQNVFILAYRNLASLKDNQKFLHWLFRIARNNIYQKYRSEKPRTESLDAIQEDKSSEVRNLASPLENPEMKILSGELQHIINQAIRRLPKKRRQVFMLSAIHKLSYREIAEIVGRSLPSVRSDIHYARVEVKNKVKKYSS